MCIGVRAAVVVDSEHAGRSWHSSIGGILQAAPAAAAADEPQQRQVAWMCQRFAAAASVLQVVLRADLLRLRLYAVVYCMCGFRHM
jgi:predicted cobalt transporter CbtA